jgi:hypothetical protein
MKKTDNFNAMTVSGHPCSKLSFSLLQPANGEVQLFGFTASPTNQRSPFQHDAQSRTPALHFLQEWQRQHIRDDHKVSVHLMITVQNTQNILNSFNHLP